MQSNRKGQIAVIFATRRAAADADGYVAAAEAMERLAAQQPGYRGMRSARGADGFGITVSYWADEESAKAWRDHPEHRVMRDCGRDRWYDAYWVDVARIERSYDWTRGD